MDGESQGFVMYRYNDATFVAGCIGEIDGKVGIVHGLGMACAAGFHPSVIKQSIEELKELAEKDYSNISQASVA